jgi:hypothetical protein
MMSWKGVVTIINIMIHECMHDTCNYEHCTWLSVPKLLSQMVVLQLSLTKYSMEKWCKDLMEFET